MNNPFMAALGGGQMPGPMGNFAQMVQQFNQFKANFKGDPKAEVEKLMQSGKLNGLPLASACLRYTVGALESHSATAELGAIR